MMPEVFKVVRTDEHGRLVSHCLPDCIRQVYRGSDGEMVTVPSSVPT